MFLNKCVRSAEAYSIEVDEEKTKRELASSGLRGRRVDRGTEGIKTEFIGPHGRVLAAIEGAGAVYRIRKSTPYLRAKVTYTRKRSGQGFEEYYAWGQPVFGDARAEKSTVPRGR